MNTAIAQHGYTYCGKCSCDGHLTEKYKNGNYQLRYRVRQQRFRIKENGSWLFQWTPITELETKLNGIKQSEITS